MLDLSVVRLDNSDEVYAQRYPVRFPDRQTIVNVHIRLRQLRFPVPGMYAFELAVDGELVAQRRLRVYQITGPEP